MVWRWKGRVSIELIPFFISLDQIVRKGGGEGGEGRKGRDEKVDLESPCSTFLLSKHDKGEGEGSRLILLIIKKGVWIRLRRSGWVEGVSGGEGRQNGKDIMPKKDSGNRFSVF